MILSTRISRVSPSDILRYHSDMQLRYPIGKGSSLSHWRYSGIEEKPVDSPAQSFYAPVNLGEAYVQIIYPVRKHFLASHKLADVQLYDGPYAHAWFPFEDSKVNFSTARPTPTFMWTNLSSIVKVPETGSYPFAIATCGAIKLWIDGREAVSYAPYDRNIPHTKEFQLELTAGEHVFQMYMEELAERDAFFYFDFIYKGEVAIEQSFETSADENEAHRAERFLESISLTCFTYCFGGIEADFDSSMLAARLHLSVSGIGSDKVFTIEPGMSHLKLEEGFSDTSRGKAFFAVDTGDLHIERKIFYNTAPKYLTDLPVHSSIEDRKREALFFAAMHGDGLMHQAMAIMKTEKRISERARAYIEKSLTIIERKEDCADFVMAPLLWSIKADRNLYPEDLYERAKEAILSFRYWIDEKGNDSMWYFSENHAFLFHTSQYLAGLLFPDSVFKASGRKGSEQRKIGKANLMTWFRNFSLYHYAEWNSATYFPVDLIGLFSLYGAAEDEDIIEKTKDALDYTFRIIRDNTFHGIMTSSFGRAYEDTVRAKELNEPSFLSYIAFGDGHATRSNRASVLFSLTPYVPPYSTEPLEEGKLRTTVTVQGLSPVWTYRAETKHWSLGSAEEFKPFQHGHQQHIMDCTFGTEAPFFINHPGEKAYSGENRPAYWAGNGTVPMTVQYKGLMMMIFSTAETEVVKYIHAYFPTWFYDSWSVEGHYAFASSGNGYLGVYFSSLPHLVTWGMNREREIIAEGEKQLCVVRLSDRAESGSFEHFKDLFINMAISYDSNSDSAETDDFAYGILSIGRDKVPTLNGEFYDWRCASGYERITEDEKSY